MTTEPTIRTLARQQGIDLKTLLRILQIRRPAGSDAEEQFVTRFLDPLPGVQADSYGNRYLTIGDNPTVMWSSHTDTVSDDGGMQNIRWSGDYLELNGGRRGQTLGADDGAGIWLMLEMIKAQKPGLYVFHRDEEIGGLGSKHIASKHPELVAGIKMAIAFDRKATHSVITFQRGKRCCSDAFGRALADALGMGYKLDQGGVFTDTASYTELIPECTNLSAGYYDEHTMRERLDVRHLVNLREAVLQLNVDNLPIERDPTKVEHRSIGYSYGGYGGYAYGYDDSDRYDSYWKGVTKSTSLGNVPATMGKTEMEMIEEIIREAPRSVAVWLAGRGMTSSDLIDAIWPRSGVVTLYDAVDEPTKADDDLVEMEVLCCGECHEMIPEAWVCGGVNDGDKCENCGSNDTYIDWFLVNQFSGEVHDYA